MKSEKLTQLLELINEMFEESDKDTISALEESMHLRDDLHMDSLMLAEFTVRIEAKFGVDIFEDGLVETIGDVLRKLGTD